MALLKCNQYAKHRYANAKLSWLHIRASMETGYRVEAHEFLWHII